jgi:N,N'-diacetyllegionaminate synthase
VGEGQPCFVIAEAGVNHNGDIDMACRLVDVAVGGGADAVKFQTFKADLLASQVALKAEYQLRNTDSAESQQAMLRRLELTREMHQILARHCQKAGILFLSTPFDQASADLLDELGVPAFKVPSGEITNLPLLSHIARKGKPMIVSTGMSYLGEVETALRAIDSEGNDRVALLHCVSNYPAAPGDVNLHAMQTMHAAFAVPVGYSDHTLGVNVALAAVALGSSILEKHFTLDRSLPGPDHAASLEPEELAAMIRGVREVEAALGDGCKRPAPAEQDTADVARRSLVAARDLPRGTTLGSEHIAILRPGTGLPPALLPQLLGRQVRVDVATGSLFRWEMLC